ncbi:MAG: anti-sigma factor family protein [Planctomycetota bacterium]
MSEPLTPMTIRLYCDGELPAEEARRVEEQLQQDPQFSARLEFEQQLKEHVDRMMRADGVPLPAGLADRVRQTLAEGGVTSRDPSAEGPRAVAGRIDAEPKPADGSRAWWRGPNRANTFAVAACLALVAGAILFGIFGPPIDSLRVTDRTDAALEAAAAVAGEHVMTTSGLAKVVEKARFHTPDEAGRGLGPFLGTPLEVFDLTDLGFEFVAGDPCEVPHCDRACHLIYKRSQGAPGLVSLHIAPDRGQFPVGGIADPGLPLATDVIPKGPACQKDVLLWTHGGRSYLLVVCVSVDIRTIAAQIQDALLAGEPAPRS